MSWNIPYRTVTSADKQVYFYTRKRSSTATNSDQQPPVFPWETEVADYPEIISGDLSPSAPSNPDEPNQSQIGHIQEDPSPNLQ